MATWYLQQSDTWLNTVLNSEWNDTADGSGTAGVPADGDTGDINGFALTFDADPGYSIFNMLDGVGTGSIDLGAVAFYTGFLFDVSINTLIGSGCGLHHDMRFNCTPDFSGGGFTIGDQLVPAFVLFAGAITLGSINITINYYGYLVSLVQADWNTGQAQIICDGVAKFFSSAGGVSIFSNSSGMTLAGKGLIEFDDSYVFNGGGSIGGAPHVPPIVFPKQGEILNSKGFSYQSSIQGITDIALGNVILPTTDTVQSGVTFGPASGLVGTYSGGGGGLVITNSFNE
jgi:hypothetical protein